MSAISVSTHPGAAPNQQVAQSRNNLVSGLNTAADVAYAAGGVSLLGGAGVLLFWPSVSPSKGVVFSGANVGFSGSF